VYTRIPTRSFSCSGGAGCVGGNVGTDSAEGAALGGVETGATSIPSIGGELNELVVELAVVVVVVVVVGEVVAMGVTFVQWANSLWQLLGLRKLWTVLARLHGCTAT